MRSRCDRNRSYPNTSTGKVGEFVRKLSLNIKLTNHIMVNYDWDFQMKKITKDILLTLMIKFFLLTMLWFFCFKGAEKNTVEMSQWLYGSKHNISETMTEH